MNLPRRRFLHLAAGAFALPTIGGRASANAYPVRPITMIVPFPAGGPTDAIARILAERMRAELGQTVVVENTSGAANGSVGVGRLVRWGSAIGVRTSSTARSILSRTIFCAISSRSR
jgi:tripartite-type tricarboxylate transporter receptor subunit TctC